MPRGFTLLEVMVALVIVTLASVALLEAVGTGLHASRSAALYDEAVVRAKSHLAIAMYGMRLEPLDQNGDDGGGFHWRLRVAPMTTVALRANGPVGPGEQASFPVVLYAISTWISWRDGDTTRQVTLQSAQVGGAAR
jgi:general secretion pathway protein I